MRLTMSLALMMTLAMIAAAACGTDPVAGDPSGDDTGGGEVGDADGGAVAVSGDAAMVTAASGPYFTQPMFFNSDVTAT